MVYEASKNKHLENPGALELLSRYGGNDEGIPYWLIFDKEGKLLADSKIRPEGTGLNAPGTNSGCPATKKKWITLLKCCSKRHPSINSN